MNNYCGLWMVHGPEERTNNKITNNIFQPDPGRKISPKKVSVLGKEMLLDPGTGPGTVILRRVSPDRFRGFVILC